MSDVPPPVATAHLFRPLGRELVSLLRGMEREAWDRRTSAGEWCVKDVVAHLLDGELRRLSSSRDAHPPPPPAEPIRSYAELVVYLDGLNAEWTRAARRLSPRVLMDLLEQAAAAVAGMMEAADPWAPATFPVAWTGQEASPMWLDIGREYTERWHHQDQIREAVEAPPLGAAMWLRPVIDISLLALPHAYRSVAPARGTRIALHVTGAAGGDWHLEYGGAWQLHDGAAAESACRVTVGDLDVACLLLHRLAPDHAARTVHVEGVRELAEPLLGARAVMVHADR